MDFPNVPVCFNLTAKISSYLDNHLIMPLLEFLCGRNVFSKQSVLKAQLCVLKETNMIDCIINVYQLLYPNNQIPEEFETRKSQVIKKLDEIEEEIRLLVRTIQSEEFISSISDIRDSNQIIVVLRENYGFTIDQIESLYTMAKLKYEIGDYNMALFYSSSYRLLVLNDTSKSMDTKWGELSMEILLQNWDKAYNLLEQLMDSIESMHVSTKQKLNYRSFLMHRGLFIFFNRQHGRTQLLNLFISRSGYLLALETLCPHLLRYIVVAVIATKAKGELLSIVISLIQRLHDVYHDPLLRFFKLIFLDFDLESASKVFDMAQQIVDQDFFAVACREEFSKCGKELIFEMICKIYSSVLISDLENKFLITLKDVYNFDSDSKHKFSFEIDKSNDILKIKSSSNSFHYSIIEKTKNIFSKFMNVQVNSENPIEYYENALSSI